MAWGGEEDHVKEEIVERIEKLEKENKQLRRKLENSSQTGSPDSEQSVSRRRFLKMLGLGAGGLAMSSAASGLEWSVLQPQNQGTSDIRAETATKGVTNGSPFNIEDTSNSDSLFSVLEGGPVNIQKSDLDLNSNNIQNVGSLSTGRVNNIVDVSTEDELVGQIRENESVRIRLQDDITTTETVAAADGTDHDLNGSDLLLDLNGHTIQRADGVDDYHIRLTDSTGESHVTVVNGTIDGNRRNQLGGSYSGEGYHELRVGGAKSLTTRDLTVREQLGFSIFTVDVDDVKHVAPTVRVEGGDLSSDSDYAGLDGIHSSGSIRTVVTGADIIAGDDACAVFTSTNRSQNVENVYIDGSLKSPWWANGVRIEIESGTPSGAAIENVNVEAEIGHCNGSNVIINNDEAGNSQAVGSVSLSGSFGGSDGPAGIDVKDEVGTFYTDAIVRNASNKGIWVRPENSGSVTIDGQIEGAGGASVYLRGGNRPNSVSGYYQRRRTGCEHKRPRYTGLGQYPRLW